MELYVSFNDLLRHNTSPVIQVFDRFFGNDRTRGAADPVSARNLPMEERGRLTVMAVGHFLTQAAAHGLIFGIIAAFVYRIRVATIPVSLHHWHSLIALFLLTDLAFYIEHRCSHRIRLLWASHSVHHSSEMMLATTAYRLSWTPILSGVFLFYLPIVWIGYDPAWVYGMVSVSLTYPVFRPHRTRPPHRLAGVDRQHALRPPRASRKQYRIPRQELWRRAAALGSLIRFLPGRTTRHPDPLWLGASAHRPEQPTRHRL